MFESIHLELEGSEAFAMDAIYESNRSVRKRGDTLNQNMDHLLPDQITYLVMIILEDYLDKTDSDYSSVDRLLRCLNFEVIGPHVLIALLKMLKSTSHLYKEHEQFYKNSILRLNVLNLDADKIIQDL